jgi:hypothetical protein
MLGEKVGIQPAPGSKNMDICDRANGENRRRYSPWPFSWCLAGRALPEVKYALTVNGYIALP